MTLLFQQTLDTSSSDLGEFGTGRIQTMMSIDAERLVGFCTSIHELWSLPLQILIGLWLLYTQVKFTFLAGIFIVILLIPINRILASAIQRSTSKMMDAKDMRISAVSEFLKGFRTVKSCGWEGACETRINRERKRELSALAVRKYLDALCVFFWATTTVIFSTLTFSLFAVSGKQLTAKTVFTSLAIFNVLLGPINAFPWVINGIVEALVSLKRVEAFLNNSREKHGSKPQWRIVDSQTRQTEYHNPIEKIPSEGKNIGGNGEYRTETSQISNPSHTLVCVTGKIGTGKSTFLSSALEDASWLCRILELIQYSNEKPGMVLSYAPQEPWIMTGTIRQNIVLSAPFILERYTEAIRAAALLKDIQCMPFKDMSFVGENGSKLSGGQRARIALARALYRKADVYLLDDILSAVDSKVARSIFENGIRGKLTSGKVVIMTSCDTMCLEAAKMIINVRQGGKVETVIQSDVVDRNLIPEEEKMIDSEGESSPKYKQSQCASLWDISKPFLTSPSRISEVPDTCHDKDNNSEAGTSRADTSGMFEEERAIGHIKWAVCKKYFAWQGAWMPLVFLSLVAMQLTRNASDLWLSYWTSSNHNNHSAIAFFDIVSLDDIDPDQNRTVGAKRSWDGNTDFYLKIFFWLAGVNAICTLFRAFSFAQGGLVAATCAHRQLLEKVMKLSPSFFLENLSGRVLNRFSSDVAAVDDILPFIFNIFLAQLFGLLGVLAVLLLTQPLLLPFLIPMGIFYALLQKFYRKSSRELRRIQAIYTSPIYSNFCSALDGGRIIQVFEAKDFFLSQAKIAINDRQRANLALLGASNWLGLRLQMMAAVISALVAGFSILNKEKGLEHVHSASLVGLSLAYLMPITGLLNGLVTSGAETEQEFVAVERIKEYIELNAQPNTLLPILDDEGMQSWPRKGDIEFRNVTVCYVQGNHKFLALKNFSLNIPSGSRFGLVGRTGAGKSTAMACLIRFVEFLSGNVFIDGIDIRSVPMHHLRKSIGYLPQEAFIFSASVRENIDPLRSYESSDIVEVLKRVGVYQLLCSSGEIDHSASCCGRENTDNGCTSIDESILSLNLGEKGIDLSQGQKQLISLARVLLRRTKIVCLDEAGSALDEEAYAISQTILQEDFRDATILEITHRTSNWERFDMIAVLENGELVECGRPGEISIRQDN